MSGNNANPRIRDWVYFATPAKGRGRVAFKILIQYLKMIICHAYNVNGNRIANVRHLRSGEKVPLAYRDDGEHAYKALFCCTLGVPEKPLITCRLV